jgi:regulator of sirC expression with transglutaminase-like and TPR domain
MRTHLSPMDNEITGLGLLDDEELTLDHAALALAGVDHPDVNLGPYKAIIDDIVTRLWEIGTDALDAKTRVAALSCVLADEFNFTGDRETYDDPDNADLIRVIDRRKGLPVSLSILYVAVAGRIGWIADALDVPGHVLVLIGDDTRPVVIDPFRGGVTVDASDLARLVASISGENAPAVRHVATMPNRAILSRLLLNQASRAEANGKGRRALTLYERITTVAPEDGNAWWHRARLELTDGDIAAGRRSLAGILEISRDPAFRARVVATLDDLPGSV